MYIAPDVAAVRQLHQVILDDDWIRYTLRDFLAVLADNLWEAYQRHDPASCIEIKNCHPEYTGAEEAAIFGAQLNLEDMRLTIAREYGFKNFDDVTREGKYRFDPLFELSVDYLVQGNYEKLEDIVFDNPRLVSQPSDFGHAAQLIHYTAVNGIEIWRQMVPDNLPAMTALLLKAGAKPESINNIYGENSDLVHLIDTSGHIKEAGLTHQTIEKLKPYIIN